MWAKLEKKIRFCSLEVRILRSKNCSCSLGFCSVFLSARKFFARTRSARKLNTINFARNSLGSKILLLVLLELENFSLGLNTKLQHNSFFILENDIMDIFRVCTLVIKTKDQFAPFSFYGYCVIMALWLVVKRTFLLFYSAFGVGCNNLA